MTKDEIEEISFKWTGVRSARNVDADTFVEACEHGDFDFVREALKNNKSLANAKNKYNKTALMRAAGEGQENIVKLLIDNDAAVNALDENNTTPLMWAVGDKRDFPDVVKLLLEAGADVNCITNPGYCGQTALDMAKYGKLEKSIAILKSWGGKSAQPVDEDAFIKACEENDIDFVIDALKSNRNLVNLIRHDGVSVLMIATKNGYTKMVKLFIDNGADPTYRDRIGSTALYWALDSEDFGVIKQQSFNIVALLINAGADVNAKDVEGSFPLLKAAGKGYYNIVHLLLMNGANVNERTYSPFGGSTALDMAEMGGHKNIMNLLRAYGAEE